VRTFQPKTVHLSIPKNRQNRLIFEQLEIFFPQYAPVIEAVRLVLNNEDFLESLVEVSISDKPEDEKLEFIEHRLSELVTREAISMLPMKSSDNIAELLSEWNNFEFTSKGIDKNIDKKVKRKANTYLERTLKTLINETVGVKALDLNIVEFYVKRFQNLILKKNIFDFVLKYWHTITKGILNTAIDSDWIVNHLDTLLKARTNKTEYDQQLIEIIKHLLLDCYRRKRR
jgi:hypothetical protein